MVSQILALVPQPATAPQSSRWVQNTKFAAKSPQTRRYLVQIGKMTFCHELRAVVFDTEELDLAVPTGIWRGLTEKQSIEAHVATKWPGYQVLGAFTPWDGPDEF